MANFDPDGEFNFVEYDDILRQIDGNESEFDLNEDILSIDEKKEGLNLSFANLTKTLIYQHNDIKNELQNLYGQLKDAKTKDRPAIKSKIAKKVTITICKFVQSLQRSLKDIDPFICFILSLI